MHEIYYKLGQPEVQDQIDVTKRLVDQYAFIDASNVAIWGWSYGGEYLNKSDVKQLNENKNKNYDMLYQFHGICLF